MEVPAHEASPATISAAAERAIHARRFLLIIRPSIIVLTIAITLIELGTGSDTIRLDNWIGIGIFVALQPIYWALMLLLGAVRTITICFMVDVIVLFWMCISIQAPAAAAASLVIPVIAVAYFRSPRFTLVYASVIAAAIIVAAPLVPGWDDEALVPASAFTVFVGGVLLAVFATHMRHTERRVERVMDEQHAALERLTQVDRSRDRLIANVSHELRTPLTMTLGFVETLLREDVELPQVERRRLMLLARDGGRRLLLLVEDLLTLGATRPDSIPLDIAPVDVGELAQRSVAGIWIGLEHELGTERELRVVERDHVEVAADGGRIEQVVTNLVVNAVRHGEGDIHVVCERAADGGAEIDVLDDGPGIEPDHVPELFLPFARFSSRTDSTGLGLAICRAVVEAHGGTIDYDRTEDDRTRFSVHFPPGRTRESV